MSVGVRGAPNLGQRVYEFMERFAPWRYTGVYSTPEFQGHIPVVSDATRISPASPTFSAPHTAWHCAARHPRARRLCRICINWY